MNERTATIERTTRETDIRLELSLDPHGASRQDISTGLGFADHMLTLMAHWAGFNLLAQAKGDLQVDAHHTIEDLGICLGQALDQSLGDKSGLPWLGWARVPMDEALADVALDLSGRAFLVFDDEILPPIIAGEEKDLWREFFKAFAFSGRFNLHIRMLYGANGHHLLESSFKGLGMALRQAVSLGRSGLLTTKGSLD